MINGPIACEGDATSHDGKLIRASGSLDIDGRRNGRLGDWVSCPEHGDNRIIEGSLLLDNGVTVAVDYCETECGSRLIGSARAHVDT